MITIVNDIADFLREQPSWVYQNVEKLIGAKWRAGDLCHVVYILFLRKAEVQGLEEYPFIEMQDQKIKEYERLMRQGKPGQLVEEMESFSEVADFIIAKKLVSPKQTVSNTLVYLGKYTKKDWRGMNLRQVLVSRYLQLVKQRKFKIAAATTQEREWRKYILAHL